MDIDRIFCEPKFSKDEYISKYGDGYSNLYLLRKDIWWCRGIDPSTKTKISNDAGAPFAAFLLIRILFNYIVHLSGTDYQNYIRKYLPTDLSAKEAEILNRLRNALEHLSYNLVWTPDIKKGEKGKIIYFAVTEENTESLMEMIDEQENEETWIVNIDQLHQAIESSINILYKDVIKNDQLSKDILALAGAHSMHVVEKKILLDTVKSRSKSHNI